MVIINGGILVGVEAILTAFAAIFRAGLELRRERLRIGGGKE